MSRAARLLDPAIREAFRSQGRWAEKLHAPFMKRLMDAALLDLEAGGWLANRLQGWAGDPNAGALPLRIAGCLHALVLGGRAAALAAQYPPRPLVDADALWRDACAALQAEPALLDAYLASPPQTNEVGRCAVIYAACAHLARSAQLPLRMLELGASAGLNLFWDRYAYRFGTLERGDPSSPVLIECDWHGEPPAALAQPVLARAGCDLNPVDIHDAAQALRLRSYVWPDQPQRLHRLERAIELACAQPDRVEPADAADWLERELAEPAAGCLTVIYHTVVWQYLPAPTRERLRRTIAAAGARASSASPLAWLALEIRAGEPDYSVDLARWPGGRARRTLASAHPHAQWIRWNPADSAA